MSGAKKEGVGAISRNFDVFCRLHVEPRLPAWVTPNQVSFFGLAWGLVAALSFVLTAVHPAFFLLAALGMFVFEVCDTVDGVVARARNLCSPRGYFLDQTVDVVVTILVFLGMGFSPYAHLEIMIWPALLYPFGLLVVLHWIHLKQRWPFPKIGPMELYAIAISLTIAMFFHPSPVLTVRGWDLTILDCAGLVMIPFGILEAILSVVRLYRELDPPAA